MKSTLRIAFIAAAFVSLSASAQTRTTFGIRAGVNFTNITGQDNSGEDMENKIKTGFNAGVNAEIPVGVDFYVQPGVLFSTKGAKFDGSNGSINLSYVEVPINFLYKPVLGAGRLIMGFGPYIAFAAGGSLKPESGDDVDLKFENEVTASEYVSNFGAYAKRIDAGANLLFGYEMSSRLSVQLNAGLGLINISPEITDLPPGFDNDLKSKNVGFGLSLGYRF